jgi:LPXTG-site transpeptidase (sortase) family protein
VERVIFPERFARLEQRVENARWILPSEDERLTLITCWPYESNTHRLVLVAKPVLGDK